MFRKSSHHCPQTFSRRRFLLLSGAATTAVCVGSGCNYFPAEAGDGFSPWDWPGDEKKPAIKTVGAAILAANPHNSQPWLFEVRKDQVDLHADLKKSLGAIDGFHREMYMGLGCAIENMHLSSRAIGSTSTIDILPGNSETHVASLQISGPPPSRPPVLLESIPHRHTNRGLYIDETPSSKLKHDLLECIDDAVHLTFIGQSKKKKSFRSAVIEAAKAITKDKEMNDASHAWWRQSEEEIDIHRDGLTADAVGVSVALRFFTKSGGDPGANKAGRYWVKNTADKQTVCSAFCVLSSRDRYSRAEQISCGRILQRIYLFATANGLSVQPLNQMPERADREIIQDLTPTFGNRLAEFVDDDDWQPQVVFRIGYAWDDPIKSPRRPVAWVIQ